MATVIMKPLVIDAQGQEIVLDGLDFTADGRITVKNAGKLIIRNCRVYKVNSNAGARTHWLNILGDIETVVDINNNYFDHNRAGIYNLLEMTAKLGDGSNISSNFFGPDACSHNTVNVYGAQENANITINNNIFKLTDGTIRIGTKGDVKHSFDIHYNEYKFVGEEADDYCKLVLVQPYGKATTSFANCKIYMDGNVIPEGLGEAYIYSGSKDTLMDETNIPKIYVNGVKFDAPILH